MNCFPRSTDRDADGDRLLHLWQLIAQHQGEAAPCYRWLAAQGSAWQPQRLLAAFPAATGRWLAAQAEDAVAAARVIATFGNLMQQCPPGDRAAHIELAIAAYSLALTVFAATTDDWAVTLGNLATAYHQRRVGDRAANLEQAIQLYEQAKAVASPQVLPVVLAGLARAYDDRLEGDRALNLERAIASYQQALALISRPELPAAWAAIATRLAAAYGDRPGGDRLQNIDEALRVYRQAVA